MHNWGNKSSLWYFSLRIIGTKSVQNGILDKSYLIDNFPFINLVGWICKVFLIMYTERVVRTQNVDLGVVEEGILGRFPRYIRIQGACAF